MCQWLDRNFRCGWLARLGQASLAIYVMHVLAGSGARIVLQKLLGITSVSLHLLVGTVLGIVLPLLALRVFERLGLRVALGLGQGRRRQAASLPAETSL